MNFRENLLVKRVDEIVGVVVITSAVGVESINIKTHTHI